MLRQRVIVVAILLPIGLFLIYLGGYPYLAFIALILGLASWEYANLFRAGGAQPASVIVVLGVLTIAVSRGIYGFDGFDWILGVFVLASMLNHMIKYEHGRDQSATDFAVTISGILYIGWIGSYMISLRNLPDGMWWFLVAMPAIWAADSGAYFYGRQFGRKKLSPRLSPKKTWEGYFAGIVSGILIGGLFAYFWRGVVSPDSGITTLNGAILGLVLSVLTTLGDLGESMIKRQFGIKDSSNLLPGHGGVFDRIDSWIWGGILSYYMITWFFI